MNEPTGKIRYAVVGLGHIAQNAVLPAFEHAKENCELVGFVSDDPKKLAELGDKYKVNHRWSYDLYDECLSSGKVDAVYIALPNNMHKDYSIRALKKGIHVLCEKPLAVTAYDCEEMIEAANSTGTKLMTAYRLHFEEANLSAVELVKAGKIGEPRIFNSVFTMQVVENNIRTDGTKGGGPLYDLGVYCINAARYIFQDEPTEVIAFTGTSEDERFKEIEEMTSAIMKFPGDRLANFTCSFGASDTAMYQVIGTKGDIVLDPAYEYEAELKYELTVEGKKHEKKFPKRDQFAPELVKFSEAILKGLEIEPSGVEGLADVRIIQAIHESARTGSAVRIRPVAKADRPDKEQEVKKPAVHNPKLVNVKGAHK